MSSIEVSDISKEDFKKRQEKQKDKDKDKEKETSNLLDETQLLKGDKKIIEPYSQLQKDNELFYFLLLAAFIFLIYCLTKMKEKNNPPPVGIDPNLIQNSFVHGIESTDVINNFENRYKNLYPTLTLELINDFPTLNEIFNGRILYINDRNLTNKYIRHVREIEDKEEEKFQRELYKDLVPNDTFNENRENLYSSNNFIDICNQQKLINPELLSKTDIPIMSEPAISIIIPIYNKRNEIMKTVRSIQNQSFRNIEIILMDDCSTENITDLYNSLLAEDPRIRVFYHLKNMGIFKSRLDAFLYSRGKYILNFNVGDLFSDNLVLEDIYNLIIKYNLDSLRFSFKTYRDLGNNNYNILTHLYPDKDIKIKYGNLEEDVNSFGYGFIFNRLIRANVIAKSFDNVNSYILNAYKNLWEDTWWNSLINYAGFSHATFNRVGYIYYRPKEEEERPRIDTNLERDSLIKEIIYNWLFDYQIGPKDGNKKEIIARLKQWSLNNNTYYGTPINLDYLNSNFTTYTYYLSTLLNDYFIEDIDKKYLGQLLNKYNDKIINITNYMNYLNSLNRTTINTTLNNP